MRYTAALVEVSTAIRDQTVNSEIVCTLGWRTDTAFAFEGHPPNRLARQTGLAAAMRN